MSDMKLREIEEYRALRATIRERSTTRLWIAVTGVTSWAFLTLATAAFLELPVASLVPLLVLAAAFDAVFAIHTAVERIGRYIQVFFEDAGEDRGWEHQAMEFGRRFPGGGGDPLFCTAFWCATGLNLIPVAIATPSPGPIEWSVVGLAHLGVAAHIYAAKRRAAGQRALDLDRYSRLKAESAAAAGPHPGQPA